MACRGTTGRDSSNRSGGFVKDLFSIDADFEGPVECPFCKQSWNVIVINDVDNRLCALCTCASSWGHKVIVEDHPMGGYRIVSVEEA